MIEVTNRADEGITTVIKEEDSSDENIKKVISTVDYNLLYDKIIYYEYALTTEDNNVKEAVVTKDSEEDILVVEVSSTTDVK